MNKKIKLFEIINSTILLAVALICVYPFLYVFFLALSEGSLLARGEVNFLPKGVHFKSFAYILKNPKFNVYTGLKNSFLYTIAGTGVAMFVTYITAYALSKKRLKSRNIILSLFVLTWIFDAGIIPQFIVYNGLGFINNPWVMIIPGAINTQFLIITKTFIEAIPDELEEAAFVDGANDWDIMTSVYLPLSKTILATVGVFYAVSIWNAYLVPQIYLKSPELHTIQQVLKDVVITSSGQSTAFKNVIIDGITLNQHNLKAAAIFIAMLPIVMVYPFVQKYFRKGIMIGAVKG